MGDFEDKLKQTLEAVDHNHHKDHYEEIELHCGHKVQGRVKAITISGKKVGLEGFNTPLVCGQCFHILSNKDNPKYQLTRRKIRENYLK